jgi:hypothetical protein
MSDRQLREIGQMLAPYDLLSMRAVAYDPVTKEEYFCLTRKDGTILSLEDFQKLSDIVRKFYDCKADTTRYNLIAKWRYSYDDHYKNSQGWDGISRHGYVYVMECNGIYKIGQSVDVAQRRIAIQYGMGKPVKILYILESCDMEVAESHLQTWFDEKHITDKKLVTNEWFKLNQDDLDFIHWLKRENLIDG